MGGRLSAFCTTVLIEQGHIRWWDLHCVRLTTFGQRLNRSVSLSEIEFQLHAFDTAVVRIEIHSDGRVQCCPRPIPSIKQEWSIHWVRREMTQDPSIKWVNRDGWNRLKQVHQVDLLGLLDENGHYLETCIGNLFIYRPSVSQWFTAPTNSPILPGVMRSVFSVAVMEIGEVVTECLCHPQTEDELWMSNAVRGMVPLGLNRCSRPFIGTLDLYLENNPTVFQHFESACQSS